MHFSIKHRKYHGLAEQPRPERISSPLTRYSWEDHSGNSWELRHSLKSEPSRHRKPPYQPQAPCQHPSTHYEDLLRLYVEKLRSEEKASLSLAEKIGNLEAELGHLREMLQEKETMFSADLHASTAQTLEIKRQLEKEKMIVNELRNQLAEEKIKGASALAERDAAVQTAENTHSEAMIAQKHLEKLLEEVSISRDTAFAEYQAQRLSWAEQQKELKLQIEVLHSKLSSTELNEQRLLMEKTQLEGVVAGLTKEVEILKVRVHEQTLLTEEATAAGSRQIIILENMWKEKVEEMERSKTEMVKHLEECCNKLSNELKDAEMKLQDALKDLATLRLDMVTQLAEQELKLRSEVQKCSALQSEVQTLNEKLVSVKQSRDQYRQHSECLAAQVEDLKRKVDEIKSSSLKEANEYAKSMAKISGELQEAREHTRVAEALAAKLRSEINVMEQKNAVLELLEQKIKSLEDDKKQLQSSFEKTLELLKNAAREESISLRQEVARLTSLWETSKAEAQKSLDELYDQQVRLLNATEKRVEDAFKAAYKEIEIQRKRR